MDKCRKFEELIHGYIDNELTSEEAKQLDSHLETCRNCQKKVDIFGSLKAALKEKIIPVSAPVSLRERIIKKQIKPAAVSRIFSLPRWAYALISVVILGGVILHQYMTVASHFFVLDAAAKVQEHIDECSDDQKAAVKIIKEHAKTSSAKNDLLQKHLNGCADCNKKIIKKIKSCMEAMAGNVKEELPKISLT